MRNTNKAPLPPVKMTDAEAKLLWQNMTIKERFNFCDIYNKIQKGEVMLKEINVNEKEVVQNIVLEDKDTPSKPTAPFAKHFKQE